MCQTSSDRGLVKKEQKCTNISATNKWRIKQKTKIQFRTELEILHQTNKTFKQTTFAAFKQTFHIIFMATKPFMSSMSHNGLKYLPTF